MVNKCQNYVVMFRDDYFYTADVYSVKRWVKVTNKGSKENLFERNETTADTEGAGSDT